MVALFSLVLPSLLHEDCIPESLSKLKKIAFRLYTGVVVVLLHFRNVGEQILRHLLSDALLYHSPHLAKLFKIVFHLRHHMIQLLLLLSRVREILLPLH